MMTMLVFFLIIRISWNSYKTALIIWKSTNSYILIFIYSFSHHRLHRMCNTINIGTTEHVYRCLAYVLIIKATFQVENEITATRNRQQQQYYHKEPTKIYFSILLKTKTIFMLMSTSFQFNPNNWNMSLFSLSLCFFPSSRIYSSVVKRNFIQSLRVTFFFRFCFKHRLK